MEELIKKHLEGWSGCKLASIQYFYETGKVSGSFFIALKEMMQEYHEQQVKNLNIPAVVGQSELLLQAYKEGFDAATASLIGANKMVQERKMQQ